MTAIQVALHNERVAKGKRKEGRESVTILQKDFIAPDAVIDESSLHEKILSECRVRGWYAVHSRMDRRTTNNVGLCDLIIFADGGKVYLVELKTKSGKLTSEQNIFIAWLAKLGQTTHVVRSMSEFLEIVNTNPNKP